jgi:hypothetical protein
LSLDIYSTRLGDVIVQETLNNRAVSGNFQNQTKPEALREEFSKSARLVFYTAAVFSFWFLCANPFDERCHTVEYAVADSWHRRRGRLEKR